jgi:hypothetical protein
MASGWFSSSSSDPTRPPDVRFQVAEEKPHGLYLQPSSGGSRSATNRSAAPTSSAYVDTTHSKTHVHNASLFDVGILKDTLVPSLTLHSGLALIAYGAARYTNRVEAKDWLWPSGQVVNAWWSAVGRRLAQGYTVSQAFSRLSWHERVILTGVTLWGGRLFYRIVRRSLQRGEDDPRYAEVKKEEGFWNSALFKVSVPTRRCCYDRLPSLRSDVCRRVVFIWSGFGDTRRLPAGPVQGRGQQGHYARGSMEHCPQPQVCTRDLTLHHTLIP